MLHKLFEPNKELSKTDKKAFIPFQNERDFMGGLITESAHKGTDQHASRNDRNLAMI